MGTTPTRVVVDRTPARLEVPTAPSATPVTLPRRAAVPVGVPGTPPPSPPPPPPPPRPAIAITDAPPSITVLAGASATTTVTLARTNYNGTVTPSVSGLPPGITASFSPATFTGANLVTILTFTAASTASAATGAAVTITASGSNVASAAATLSLTVTPLPPPPPPPSGASIPFSVMNLDANDASGAAVRGRAVIPLTAALAVTSADLTTKVRVLLAGVEQRAYIGTLDTTDAEWGGGIVYHHGAPRDATTRRWTQSAGSRPLLALVVEVDCAGLAFGDTRDFVLSIGTAPATSPLTPLGWVWAENAPQIRINAADPTKLEVFPFGFWPTSWGKRVAGFQGLDPTIAAKPIRVSGLLPKPEGGTRTPSGIPSLDTAITAGASALTVFYRIMWANALGRIAVARTPGHVDNASNSDYFFNDVSLLAGFKITIAAGKTFVWGTTPLNDPMVTSLVQGTLGGAWAGYNTPYGSAIGTARIADTQRHAFLDVSSGPADAQIMEYDMVPHWPKALGWCTDADYLCSTNIVNGALPKPVTDIWPDPGFADTDYTLRRHVTSGWGNSGRYYSVYGNANYNPQRPLIAEHLRTAHPFWLIVAISGVPPFTRFNGPRNLYQMGGEDKNANVGLANLYCVTGMPDIVSYIVRTSAYQALREIRPSSTSVKSTRYPIKAANSALWCARLGNCWRPSTYDGQATGYTDGWTAFKHGHDLVRLNFGQDGADGTATASPGFMSDYGSAESSGIRDSTNRVVRIGHKTLFAEGLVAEALVDFLDYCGGDAPIGIAATMVANAKADLLTLGLHGVDERTWRGTRPWLGEVVLPVTGNVQEGWNYVSDENGGNRYFNQVANVVLNGPGSPPIIPAWRWDPTLNGGAGAWTNTGTLTHQLSEARTDLAYVPGGSPLQRPRPQMNGVFYQLVGYLSANQPTHAYAARWRSILDLMLRRTTSVWNATGTNNNGIPFFDVGQGSDRPAIADGSSLQVRDKGLGEGWCGYGYGMRDFAIAMGYPTSV